MEEVTCSLEVELTDHQRIFGDGWDFIIPPYTFTKISDTRVKVEYRYQDEITRIEEDGTHVSGLTTWSEAYIKAEENLQTLLDIITLDRSGVGLRIIPNSLEQNSPHMRSHRINDISPVNIVDLSRIEERFKRLLDNGSEKLYDALRMNRLASNEDNTGEQIGQLWGAVEILYASNSPKVLDTKEKREELTALIDKAGLIGDEEKTRLKQRVIDTDAKSIPRMVAEKLSLSDGEGNQSNIEDVQAKVSDWRNVRSPQAHGNVLLRSREANFLESEMEHLLEQILSAEINPSGYVFTIFHPSQAKDALFKNKHCKEDPSGSGYLSRGIHVYASMDMVENIRFNLKDEKSTIYLVDYESIIAVTTKTANKIELSDCPDEAQEFIQDRMDFLNHRPSDKKVA